MTIAERRARNATHLATCLSGHRAAAAGFRTDHPGWWRSDFLIDFCCFREAGKRIARRCWRVVAVKGPLAGAKRGPVNGALSFLRPFVEKFQCVFEAGYFANDHLPVLHENGAVKHPIAHQILQLQRILNSGIDAAQGWLASRKNMGRAVYSVKTIMCVGKAGMSGNAAEI